MEILKDHNEKPIAIIYRDEDWQDGLSFPTPEDLYIQAGCWQYPAGKKLRSHFHKKYERVAEQTQEVVYVKNGSMRINFYNKQHEEFQNVIVKEGDFCVIADIGHGYEILEDHTQILEIKNGPFFDVAKDKEFVRPQPKVQINERDSHA